MERFEVGGEVILPGERRLVVLPVSRLSNHTQVTLPVQVIRGHARGRVLAVTAAVHGDELNGVEIIRRLARMIRPEGLAGTLMCVPVVNAYGFVVRSRYMPDRRDLNRSFPGSATGSLAARLAHLLLTEVIARADVGIDLHTAAVHRVNLPQIRSAFSKRPSARELARAFGAEVVLDSPERAGSLRKAAADTGKDVLVYEGGEGLRYDEFAITAGVDGIARVMEHLRMIEIGDGDGALELKPEREPVFADSSKWVRAPEGGVLRTSRRIGEAVSEGDVIGHIASPYEDGDLAVRAPCRGIIIGRTTLPIVNMGDALFHIAWSRDMLAGSAVRRGAKASPVPGEGAPHADEPVLDEDEII
ncbi:MAG: succinylglutamate desuccinylase/aspartoacylase family protein [Hyphomicrobiaceae bacterium]